MHLRQRLKVGSCKRDRDNGRILTPDCLRVVCAGFDYDPEAIGKYMLEKLAKFRNEGIVD